MAEQNWDDFRFVLAVAEQGSLNAASRKLGVNHATVLRRVNGFQERFGIQVFDREASGYRIRPNQTAFIDALNALRDSIETTERALAGQVAGLKGPVKITSTDSLCDSVLPAIVAGLRGRHPDLSLELLASNQRLDLGQLDAEVTVRPAKSLPDDLVGTRVSSLAFGVFGHKSYLSKQSGPHDWLACSGPLLRSPAGAWQSKNVESDQITLSADSFLSLHKLCKQGMGLAILPCCIVALSDNLIQKRDFFSDMTTEIWVANHRDLNDMPRIAACREYLVEKLRDQSDLLSGLTFR